jgi:hypothetical protein
MARRIDIELTSARPDGTWTWRAAGALKPRGVLDGTLLYEGAKTGDTVRADAEFEIDGITIVGVVPPKEKKRQEPERLEILGPPRDRVPSVTTSLAARPDARRPDGPPRGPRRGPEARPGPGDAARRPARPPADQPPRAGPGDADRPPRPTRDAGSRERRPRPARHAAPSEPARHDGPSEPARRDRPSRQVAVEAPARPKARRLSPGSGHRTAVLDSLPPEQRPIAEQVLRGGIPAVRTAIHLEREKATAEGRTAPNADALLGIAEELLPRLKAAEWRDRAEAAAKIADEIGLRDLRSVVAGADVARDEEGRQLATTLREALERRVEELRQGWIAEVRQNLEEGRVVRALRLAARPPEPATRVPAELAAALADAAGAAMTAETPPDRWAALLDAVTASPVGRSVKPLGLPADPPEALLQAARQSSGRIPALAPMLGIAMPPPPGPPRPLGRPARASVQPKGRARRTPPHEPAPQRSAPPPSSASPAPAAAEPGPGAVAVTSPAEPPAPTADPAVPADPSGSTAEPGETTRPEAEGPVETPASTGSGPDGWTT